ncbi:MAG: hypothetical protein JWO25_2872 [Alphaproteobacteria bacterium]|nr:hypothetical protein [Alphaproteobacteria bacterium]MDB5720267.1 hypothetical protein [Alphaproteobacteria bacterium]
MRKFILAAALVGAATPGLVSAPAVAQGPHERHAMRDCQKDLRNSGSNREYRRESRDCQRDIARAQNRDWRTYRNYDYNRYENGNNSYYADQYYRDGRYYQERRLSRNDRVYRGQDGRYYCRRSDGTTGLIVGAAAGGLLGNALDNGRSSLLGTLIGAGAGAAIGRSVDRNNSDVRCR